MMRASLISLSNLASVWKLGEWFTCRAKFHLPLQCNAMQCNAIGLFQLSYMSIIIIPIHCMVNEK